MEGVFAFAKPPDELIQDIEAAEEAKSLKTVVAYIHLLSTDIVKSPTQNGGVDDWSEAAEAAFDALYRLVKGGGNTDENETEPPGNASSSFLILGSVFCGLKPWRDDEAIVEVGLGCIVAIASRAIKQETTTEAEANNHDDETYESDVDVDFVFELMRDFGGESTVQEQACLAIEGLALWKPSWKRRLRACHGIRGELLKARNERITNQRNKAYPVRAAKALGIELELENE